MAGYQTYTPSFFVNLQQNEPSNISIRQLQQTLQKPAQVLLDNSLPSGNAIADGQQLIGTYVTFASTGSIDFPSAVDMYQALKNLNNELLGSQGANTLIPREALITPQVGASFYTTLYNSHPNYDVVLSGGYAGMGSIYVTATTAAVIHSTLVIDDPENPVWCVCKLDGTIVF